MTNCYLLLALFLVFSDSVWSYKNNRKNKASEWGFHKRTKNIRINHSDWPKHDFRGQKTLHVSKSGSDLMADANRGDQIMLATDNQEFHRQSVVLPPKNFLRKQYHRQQNRLQSFKSNTYAMSENDRRDQIMLPTENQGSHHPSVVSPPKDFLRTQDQRQQNGLHSFESNSYAMFENDRRDQIMLPTESQRLHHPSVVPPSNHLPYPSDVKNKLESGALFDNNVSSNSENNSADTEDTPSAFSSDTEGNKSKETDLIDTASPVIDLIESGLNTSDATIEEMQNENTLPDVDNEKLALDIGNSDNTYTVLDIVSPLPETTIEFGNETGDVSQEHKSDPLPAPSALRGSKYDFVKPRRNHFITGANDPSLVDSKHSFDNHYQGRTNEDRNVNVMSRPKRRRNRLGQNRLNGIRMFFENKRLRSKHTSPFQVPIPSAPKLFPWQRNQRPRYRPRHIKESREWMNNEEYQSNGQRRTDLGSNAYKKFHPKIKLPPELRRLRNNGKYGKNKQLKTTKPLTDNQIINSLHPSVKPVRQIAVSHTIPDDNPEFHDPDKSDLSHDKTGLEIAIQNENIELIDEEEISMSEQNSIDQVPPTFSPIPLDVELEHLRHNSKNDYEPYKKKDNTYWTLEEDRGWVSLEDTDKQFSRWKPIGNDNDNDFHPRTKRKKLKRRKNAAIEDYSATEIKAHHQEKKMFGNGNKEKKQTLNLVGEDGWITMRDEKQFWEHDRLSSATATNGQKGENMWPHTTNSYYATSDGNQVNESPKKKKNKSKRRPNTRNGENQSFPQWNGKDGWNNAKMPNIFDEPMTGTDLFEKTDGTTAIIPPSSLDNQNSNIDPKPARVINSLSQNWKEDDSNERKLNGPLVLNRVSSNNDLDNQRQNKYMIPFVPLDFSNSPLNEDKSLDNNKPEVVESNENEWINNIMDENFDTQDLNWNIVFSNKRKTEMIPKAPTDQNMKENDEIKTRLLAPTSTGEEQNEIKQYLGNTDKHIWGSGFVSTFFDESDKIKTRFGDYDSDRIDYSTESPHSRKPLKNIEEKYINENKSPNMLDDFSDHHFQTFVGQDDQRLSLFEKGNEINIIEAFKSPFHNSSPEFNLNPLHSEENDRDRKIPTKNDIMSNSRTYIPKERGRKRQQNKKYVVRRRPVRKHRIHKAKSKTGGEVVEKENLLSVINDISGLRKTTLGSSTPSPHILKDEDYERATPFPNFPTPLYSNPETDTKDDDNDDTRDDTTAFRVLPSVEKFRKTTKQDEINVHRDRRRLYGASSKDSTKEESSSSQETFSSNQPYMIPKSIKEIRNEYKFHEANVHVENEEKSHHIKENDKDNINLGHKLIRSNDPNNDNIQHPDTKIHEFGHTPSFPKEEEKTYFSGREQNTFDNVVKNTQGVTTKPATLNGKFYKSKYSLTEDKDNTMHHLEHQSSWDGPTKSSFEYLNNVFDEAGHFDKSDSRQHLNLGSDEIKKEDWSQNANYQYSAGYNSEIIDRMDINDSTHFNGNPNFETLYQNQKMSQYHGGGSITNQLDGYSDNNRHLDQQTPFNDYIEDYYNGYSQPRERLGTEAFPKFSESMESVANEPFEDFTDDSITAIINSITQNVDWSRPLKLFPKLNN